MIESLYKKVKITRIISLILCLMSIILLTFGYKFSSYFGFSLSIISLFLIEYRLWSQSMLVIDEVNDKIAELNLKFIDKYISCSFIIEFKKILLFLESNNSTLIRLNRNYLYLHSKELQIDFEQKKASLLSLLIDDDKLSEYVDFVNDSDTNILDLKIDLLSSVK